MYDYFTKLNDYIENSSVQNPEKIALIYGNKKFTYQEMDNFANQFCHYLLETGVQPGERVVVSLGNCFETVIGFWGTLKAGAVISIVSPDTIGEKLKYIIEDSGASLLLCSKTQYDSIIGYREMNITLKEHTKCDDPRVAAGPGVEPSRRNTRQPTRR
ncbi:MAG: acyl--CoA ligase [Legionellales bacterium]|nr:acyl--CoA ligase [Legionellales bacterium]